MAELLVKTYTRHRNSSDPYYMKDWTAGDILCVMPDGFYTKNKHQGAKRMGIVLLVEADLPKEYAYWSEEDKDKCADKENWIKELGRTKYIADLRYLLTDQQLKDAYNHDILVNPIRVTQSYLDWIKPRSERTTLDVYDKSGTFDNEIVDVGPNGHPDANTFLEFESNVAETLTGPTIGDCDEQLNETGAISISGITAASDKYLEFRASGDGFHGGKWNDNAQTIVVSNGIAVNNSIAHVRLTGLQIKTTGTWIRYGYYCGLSAANDRIDSCIFASTNTGSGSHGIYIGGSFGVHKIFNTIVYDNVNSSGIHISAGTDVDILNCTIEGCSKGIECSGGTVDVANCAIFNNGDDFSGAFNSISHCASDDGDGTDAQTLDSTNDYENEFTDAPNHDYSLVSGSVCVGNGTDDPGSGLFSDDIIGSTRSSPWDIGAFEYVSGGGEEIIKIISETAGASDSIQKTIAINKLIAETAGASDIINKQLRLFKSIGETVAAADSPSKRIGITKTQNEAVGAVDTAIKRIGIYKILSESAAAVDARVKKLAIIKIWSEIAGAVEHITKHISIIKIRGEVAGALDAAARALGIVKVHDETAGAGDATSKASGIVKVISEMAGAVDSRIKRLWITKAVNEAAGVTDSPIKRLSITKMVDENVAALDNTTKRLGISKIVSEIAGAIDTVIKWVRSVAGWRETILLRSPISRTVSLNSAVVTAESLKSTVTLTVSKKSKLDT